MILYGIGYIYLQRYTFSVVSFPDLIPELVTLIHEACEPKKQEDKRKKKKREVVRAVLAKVFSRLAQNKV